jgi:hypothetical protein
MTKPLHPNLARLAAAYDEILERHQQGRITPRQAKGEVSALVGRDDSGLVWMINPVTGRWCYRNLRGELVEAEPPRYGVPSVTPAELGAGQQGNLDQRVTFFDVAPETFLLPTISVTSSKRRMPLEIVRALLRRLSASS